MLLGEIIAVDPKWKGLTTGFQQQISGASFVLRWSVSQGRIASKQRVYAVNLGARDATLNLGAI